MSKERPSRLPRKLISLSVTLMLLAGCAAPEKPPVETAPDYWSVSRSVESDAGMVTLFDPTDLAHQEKNPEGWYRYDFAFANDLESGRFAAVYTDKPGTLNVRLTTGPLTDIEQAAAGPNASLRLRIINHRILLSGGDTWPSNVQSAMALAADPRWIGFENGDYRVVITILDRQQGANHDVVFQLFREDNIVNVDHAPGIPYLVVGQKAKVLGIGAGGLRFNESCGRVPTSATWSPLSSSQLPLPGDVATINVASRLHGKGFQLQSDGLHAAVPVLVARNPVAGTLGIYIEPESWPNTAALNGEVPVKTRVLCAVAIQSVVPGIEGFELLIEPLPGAQDPIHPTVHRQLVEHFDTWIRQSGDPAWRFKSAQIQRTQGHRSLLLGMMKYLKLSAKHTEALLMESNAQLASRLMEHMRNDYVSLAE